MINEKKEVLTIEETGQLLGISRNSAYEAVRRGEIPVIRIGRRCLVPRVAFEELLASVKPIVSLSDRKSNQHSNKGPCRHMLSVLSGEVVSING